MKSKQGTIDLAPSDQDTGHGPAFIVLDPSTNKITYRSRIKKIKFDVLQDQLSQHQRERYRPFQDENANNGMYGIIDGGSNQTQCGFSFQELGSSSWTDRYVETTALSGVREGMRIGTQFAIAVACNADGKNAREVKVVVHEGACAPGSPHYEGSVEVEGSIGGESVLSILQMQDQGLVIDTLPRSEGGYQCVYVPGRNIIIPLSIRDGITYMPLRPADDEDIIEIDEVITLTSGRRPWRPGFYDSEAEYDDVNDYANGGDGVPTMMITMPSRVLKIPPRCQALLPVYHAPHTPSLWSRIKLYDLLGRQYGHTSIDE